MAACGVARKITPGTTPVCCEQKKVGSQSYRGWRAWGWEGLRSERVARKTSMDDAAAEARLDLVRRRSKLIGDRTGPLNYWKTHFARTLAEAQYHGRVRIMVVNTESQHSLSDFDSGTHWFVVAWYVEPENEDGAAY